MLSSTEAYSIDGDDVEFSRVSPPRFLESKRKLLAFGRGQVWRGRTIIELHQVRIANIYIRRRKHIGKLNRSSLKRRIFLK